MATYHTQQVMMYDTTTAIGVFEWLVSLKNRKYDPENENSHEVITRIASFVYLDGSVIAVVDTEIVV